MPFELKLKLENDPEFRKYLKTLIKGQCESITREDIRSVMLPEMINKTFTKTTALKEFVEKLFKDEVTKAFNKGKSSYFRRYEESLTDYIKKCIDKEVKRIVGKELNGKKLHLKVED